MESEPSDGRVVGRPDSGRTPRQKRLRLLIGVPLIAFALAALVIVTLGALWLAGR